MSIIRYPIKLKLVVCQIIFLNLLLGSSSAQILSVGSGQMFYTSKTIVPVVNQVDRGNNEEYHSLDFAFIEFEKYLIGTEFSTYDGWIDFNASDDMWLGFGSNRVRLWRVSPYIGHLIYPKKRFRFIPYFKVIIEQSLNTGLSSGRSRVTEVDRPNSYKGTIYIEPIQRLQIAPGTGLMLSWNPFSRFYLHGNIYYTYGYRPFQKYYFEYSYQGVKQPTAEWHANGTGVFTSLSIGYKIWNTNKDSKSHK